ncbi:glutathione synthase [Terasakiella sp. A23]|uniref:glutathione synthase n=1 Tax=Terasakiella sp. FCG-A23 TaxID=3080561 RepID=UPI002952DE89|nr:glutathione synthase [Terasakiella sp. A23]MDV7339909.1 glutathione synthase [Terasakiella sp. A23]
MSLRVAIQMDPIESIDINGDSTFVMGLEAQSRGYSLFHYLPQDLTMVDGRVVAKMRPMTLKREEGNHFTLGEPEWLDLRDDVDVVLMRQDPPFDMAYITATHLLEHVHPDTFVVNDPAQVRNAPEKLFVTKYADLMPPTLITSNKEQVEMFREKHKDIIVKPLFGNGGAGVFHLKPGDENLNSLIEMFELQYREPMMVQAYLSDVRKGDKRIILVDGKAVGAVNRIPAEGEARSNMHVGGRPAQSDLTEREQEICERIGQDLKDRDLIFVGIDVIGDYMTEINVTSPTGLQEINRFDGTCLEADIWDAIELRVK